MVDLDWIAAKLIERERAAKDAALAKWRKRVKNLMNANYTTKFNVNGFSVDVTVHLDRPEDYHQWLQDMQDAGFAKPVYGKRDTPSTFPAQYGTVTAIGGSDKKWNGKQMYEVTLSLRDGNEAKVNVFNKREWRVGDEAYYSVNEKGYPKLEAFAPEDADEEIPF